MKKEDSKSNNPTLFISTVSDQKQGGENQGFYDSRTSKRKKHTLCRLDDIKAMLLYKIDVLCEIKTKDGLIEGYIKKLEEKSIHLLSSGKYIDIEISLIEDINILEI